MNEWTALDCISDIADMMYHKTGHKWWFRLAIDAAIRKNRIWDDKKTPMYQKRRHLYDKYNNTSL